MLDLTTPNRWTKGIRVNNSHLWIRLIYLFLLRSDGSLSPAPLFMLLPPLNTSLIQNPTAFCWSLWTLNLSQLPSPSPTFEIVSGIRSGEPWTRTPAADDRLSRWHSGEESPCQGDARDAGWIRVLGRSPGVGNGNSLQYSCLGNSMGDKKHLTDHNNQLQTLPCYVLILTLV